MLVSIITAIFAGMNAEAADLSAQLLNDNKAAVVQIDTTLAGLKIASASGFIVDKAQYIVTSARAVMPALDGGVQVKITTGDGKVFTEDKIKVISCPINLKPDICVLSIGPLVPKPFVLALNTPKKNDTVYTIGASPAYKLGKARITKVRKDSRGFEVFQLKGVGGNTGSPIFDEKNALFGVASAAGMAYSTKEILSLIRRAEGSEKKHELFADVRKLFQTQMTEVFQRVSKQVGLEDKNLSTEAMKKYFVKRTFYQRAKDPLYDPKRQLEYWIPGSMFECKQTQVRGARPGLRITCRNEDFLDVDSFVIGIEIMTRGSEERGKMRSSLLTKIDAGKEMSPAIDKIIKATKVSTQQLSEQEKQFFYLRDLGSKCEPANTGGELCTAGTLNNPDPGRVFIVAHREFIDSAVMMRIEGMTTPFMLEPILRKFVTAIATTASLVDKR